MNQRSKLIVLTSLIMPLSMISAFMVALVLKSLNPLDVNVEHDLAYLGFIVITYYVIFIGLAVRSFLAGRALKQAGDAETAHLTYTLLVTQVVVGIALPVLQNLSDKVTN